MNHFTPEQWDAVTFVGSPDARHNLVIEAGAGAGKTHVLAQRVRWLLTSAPPAHRLRPHDIGLVTFTNEAQRELRERIEAVLQGTPMQRYTHHIHVSTIDGLFDTLTEQLYARWWSGEGQLPSVSLMEPEKAVKQLEKQLSQHMEHWTAQCPPQQLAHVIDFMLAGGLKKSALAYRPQTWDFVLNLMCQEYFLSLQPQQIRLASQTMHPATPFFLQEIHQLARAAYKARVQKGQLTYADKAVFLKEQLLTHKPFVLRELIVDEYQDTNAVQHDILCQLARQSQARLVVVGDPKQGIYGFRGASVEVMSSLKKDVQWQCLVLDKNFRTQSTLLQEMNTLTQSIFDWQDPRHPAPYTDSVFYEEARKKWTAASPLQPQKDPLPAGPSVYVVSVFLESKTKDNINTKAPLVYAKFLKELQAQEGFDWDEMVILCERNSQVQALQNAFEALQVPLKNKPLPTVDSALARAVGWSLTLCLAGIGSRLDWYQVLTSPLVSAPVDEIVAHFTQKDHQSAAITRVEDLVTTHRTLASQNFFLAWQQLRWALANTDKDPTNSTAFCQQMDAYAKSLWQVLRIPATRHQVQQVTKSGQGTLVLEKDLLCRVEQAGILPMRSKTHKGLDIRTIHKAKGLQWPYVCVYPRYGLATPGRNLTASVSASFLDISWLHADLESMSVVSRVQNPHFPHADSCPKERKGKEPTSGVAAAPVGETSFAHVRQAQEDAQERQRVLYTALTRAEKKLILLQPMMHHSSKRGLKDLACEKKTPSTSDYLEQDMLLKYIQEHFQTVWATPTQETPLATTFVSPDGHRHLVHLNATKYAEKSTDVFDEDAKKRHNFPIGELNHAT